MRYGLGIAALLTVLSASMALSGGVRAEGKSLIPEEKDAETQGLVGEACFGDRYETDNDINEGNRISEEEILRLINPPRT